MVYPNPLDALFGLQQALDSYRDSSWLDTGTSSGGAYPPINVFQKGDDLVAIAELPGVEKKDIELQVKGNMIRIAGSKTVMSAEQVSVHRRERLTGKFDRAISLPVEIDAERVKAECRDGLLAVYLPRAEHDKPRTININ